MTQLRWPIYAPWGVLENGCINRFNKWLNWIIIVWNNTDLLYVRSHWTNFQWKFPHNADVFKLNQEEKIMWCCYHSVKKWRDPYWSVHFCRSACKPNLELPVTVYDWNKNILQTPDMSPAWVWARFLEIWYQIYYQPRPNESKIFHLPDWTFFLIFTIGFF